MTRESQLRLREIMATLPPRIPGKRSEQLAQKIMAIPERQRTTLQLRVLAAYERGECIGCNQQGEPLRVHGKELPVTREPSGFAAPAEFCDCSAGVSFREQIRRQRREYLLQDIRMRQAHAQRLFGTSDALSPLFKGKTLDTWPVILERDEDTDETLYLEVIRRRELLVQVFRYYAEHLCFEHQGQLKHGICLIGSSGVGKTGLVHPIAPMLARRGHYMLSLYVPELFRLVRHSTQTEEIIKMLKTVEVLFLDDLGNPLLTDPISSEMHSFLACIFDERFKHNRPTLITSNLDEDMLETQFGTYILSRIQGLCHFYFVPGEDLR